MHCRLHRASKLLCAVLTSAALVGVTGCAADDASSSAEAMTQAPAEAVVIDETGDGLTFEVREGQEIILRLPGNITTGYEWSVASTDRTFGYPSEEQYLADGDRIGGGGVFEFVWRTDGPLPMVGSHTVVMHHARAWEEEPIEEFTFTVEIVADDSTSSEPLVIDESGDGMAFDAQAGTDVVVRLAGNPTTGYEWMVASTDRTFGYPVSEQYIPDEGPVGSGGLYEFVWATAGALPMEGSHTVVLEYRRSWEDEAADSFTFTVNVQAAAQD